MPKQTSGAREDRLKAALKANMARRKAQTRARGTEPNTQGRRAQAGDEAKKDG